MRRRISDSLRGFLALESSAGIALVIASVTAMVIANTPVTTNFQKTLDPYRSFTSQWFMAIFFFLVGLEIRNEIRHGEMRNPKNAAFPVIAAVGGMAIPALIFAFINRGTEALSAWAVPMPTDIALALGTLALLGSRIDTSLKIFLLTLAIADDLFSIIVLGILYSNTFEITKFLTTIGVVTVALLMPESSKFPTVRMIRIIHPWSAFLVIPLFVLTNIGIKIDFANLWENLSTPVTSGIIFGRVIGKMIGITLFAWLAVTLKIANKPSALSYLEILGASALAGMGLTVSIFIAQNSAINIEVIQQIKLGLIFAAVLSALVGIFILRKFSKAQD
jgi:NhaA family Na+:H+ antiporter